MSEHDHERIWLQNAEDGRASGEGRLWCQDKVWPDDPEDGEPTEYVRADIANALLTALKHLVGTVDYYGGPASQHEAFHEATAAIAKAQPASGGSKRRVG